jgi:hypothetical protein
MIQSTKYTFLLVGLLLLSACAKKLTEEVVVPTPIDKEDKLPRKRTQQLLRIMDSLSTYQPSFFYAKIGTDYTDTNRSVSFKTSIRMVNDSATNVLITYAKIPIVNANITTDSITLVNKRDKCYMKESLGYIKESFGIEFDYTHLEELIMGYPLGYDTSQRYFKINDPFDYTISSHKKRELKRLDRQPLKESRENVIVKYILNDSLNALQGMIIESPDDTTTIVVSYIERTRVEGYLLPQKVNLTITSPRNTIRLVLDYEKIEVNKPQPLYLVIPEEYEKCP